MGAIRQYTKALEFLKPLDEKLESDGNAVSVEVTRALELLRQDIEVKTRELENMVELQKPLPAKNTSIVGSLWNMTSSSLPGMTKTRSVDSARSARSPSNGLIMDPLLVSLVSKLQANLVNGLREEMNDEESFSIQEAETLVSQQIAKFKKELGIYEQKKVKDHNLRLDQAITENKKLSNQIIKLRERWDSLVESAKQRRSRKQDE